MGLHVTVRTDFGPALRFMKDVERKAIPRALPLALNVVTRRVRNEAITEVHKIRRVKKSVIKQAIALVRASTSRPRALVVALHSRVIPLRDYGARKVRAGVTVNVEGKRKLLPYAFISDARAGNVLAKTRKGEAGLKVLFGPSINTGFRRPDVLLKLKRVIERDWRRVFNEKMNAQLAKARARVR